MSVTICTYVLFLLPNPLAVPLQDGSGEIDPEELQNALNELGRRTSLSEAVEMIAKYDDDDSMTIGLDEFIDLMSNAGSEEVRHLYFFSMSLCPSLTSISPHV